MMRTSGLIGVVLCALAGAAPALAQNGLDPRQVVDEADAAVAAIGLLTGTGTRCTGFLAGADRVVVTAAQCVLDRDGKPSQDRFTFQPGYRNGKSAASFGARVVVTGAWRATGDPRAAAEPVAENWAILLTDQATGIAPLALATDISSNQLTDRPLAAVGYSVDVESGRFAVEDAPCRVTRVQAFRLHHDCRGSVGAAGAPIFLLNADGSRGPVAAVVVQGAASSTAERLAIAGLMRLAPMRGLPEVDFGGRAVVIGALVNAAKVAANASPNQSAMR